MLAGIIGFLWELLKIPVKLVVLPLKILSLIFSLIFYGALLLVLAAIVFVFVL